MPVTDLDPSSVGTVARRPLHWLWPRRIPIGKITLLAGDPGLGKSMLALDIAARLSRGLAFPDAVPPTPEVGSLKLGVGSSPVPANGSMTRSPDGPIPSIENQKSKIDNSPPPSATLLLSAEDDPADTIRPRLEAAGADLARIHLPHPDSDSPQAFSPFSLQDPENLDMLKMAVECTEDVRLLIIDPICAYLGNCNTARNDSVRKILAPLAAFAASHDIAILAITHLRKTSSQRAIYRAMDSLAFAAASRSVWFLTADPGDRARRLLCAAKANLAQEAPALAFRIHENHLAWETQEIPLTADEALAKPAAPHHSLDRRDAMAWLTEILSQATIPAEEIEDQARKLGISYGTLRRAKGDLGIITDRAGFGRLGSWLWRLPETEPAAVP